MIVGIRIFSIGVGLSFEDGQFRESGQWLLELPNLRWLRRRKKLGAIWGQMKIRLLLFGGPKWKEQYKAIVSFLQDTRERREGGYGGKPVP